ncbi:DNA-binding transcriptional LysR family regulator [Actinoalloteichus hoggarensis]|uniref:HTH-type transcriptional regulator BenM n=1 Tax=Actinoalloteichus hoggarensis TaxID=1470176 RepID=A0A221W5Z7_9PSEU|nr:LysR family transcriptional regulator [Actinoalloteichus hoggarensis]ASO21278.1 HTH-type transcriptional regulator BenM [Actinoalloteichus hoggarensis]MBB5921210.1 DNA-binding transcriptional LysR family regulator [Actinoalloteichus hoggarensis]
MDRPELPLPQLHAFVVLAEELHFGHAATRLGIAQPPLSQQIRRLEDRVGHRLLCREPGRVTLTPAGRELLPAARLALAGLADGLAAARAVGSGTAGTLRIGFAASLALTVLPGLLRAFRERSPGVTLDIREMTTTPQLAALQDGAVDIGLLREPPPEDEAAGLGFTTVLTEPFVAVLPAGHPLADRRTVPVAALADHPFVLLPRAVGPRLHDQIIGLCTAAGFAPEIAQHAVEWQTVCALVETGLGVSLAPASIRRIRMKGVAFRRVDPDTVRTRVAVAWRADDRNPLVTGLLAAVRPAADATRAAASAARGVQLPEADAVAERVP